jgi:hypothetical protein
MTLSRERLGNDLSQLNPQLPQDGLPEVCKQ